MTSDYALIVTVTEPINIDESVDKVTESMSLDGSTDKENKIVEFMDEGSG
jgi:hypothetical protein